jgi:hypothetical protein
MIFPPYRFGAADAATVAHRVGLRRFGECDDHHILLDFALA